MSIAKFVMNVVSSFIHSDVAIIADCVDRSFAVGVVTKLFLVTKLDIRVKYRYTRKNLTTCSKSANKPLTSCLQVWNKLLTTCSKLVHIVRLVTRLFQQGCYNHNITILPQPCVVNLVNILAIS